MSDFMMIGLRESGQKRRTDGRLQDFVHEATQIDKLTNSEQNRHLQTINSKKNQITKSHNHYNFNIKQIQPKFYQRTYHQSGDDS